MKRERPELGREQEPNISLAPPVVELLADPARAATYWGEKVGTNPEFVRQLEERHELNKRLDAIIKSLPRPDMSLPEAVATGRLSEQQVADLYESLSPLLEKGSEYQRLALYLPFEFLPPKNWQPRSKELQEKIQIFSEAYLGAWKALLPVHDVRANFVDGDVLEVEKRTGDLPRVVKAAHLIPKLVEVGLLSLEDVFQLLETSKDITLRKSVAETFPVLADLGYINEPELGRLQRSYDQFVHDKVVLIMEANEKAGRNQTEEQVDVPSVQAELETRFQAVDSEVYAGSTPNREKWLRESKKRKVIEAMSDKVKTIFTAEDGEAAVPEVFKHADTAEPLREVFIEGLRKAVEEIGKEDLAQGKEPYQKYESALLASWKEATPGIQNALLRTLRRLNGLGIVPTQTLEKLSIQVLSLAGPFFENARAMEPELEEIKKSLVKLEKNEELSQAVYPVVLLFSSKLKGYGTDEADLDLAVFVKPGVPFKDKGRLREVLHQTFDQKRNNGDIKEFWLEETEKGLAVRDPEPGDYFQAGGSWTHMLFGSLWEGDAETIKQLREKLFVPYFSVDPSKIIEERSARQAYLEELERGTLQYRLMHKGYERVKPSFPGLDSPHAGEVDGQSAFWDSGYRQVATQLFARRIFLPKIE